jgi:hypothetical protein
MNVHDVFSNSLWKVSSVHVRSNRILTRSLASSWASRIRKIRSNLDKIVVWKSMFSPGLFISSYRPKTGLAAARTLHLVLSMVVIPALAIETVPCSIASCIATRSSSRLWRVSTEGDRLFSLTSCRTRRYRLHHHPQEPSLLLQDRTPAITISAITLQ